MIYKDAYLSIDGVDVSEYLQSLEAPESRETQDPTHMGDNTRRNAAGLKTWTVTANFHQSFVDGELDEKLYELFNAGVPFIIEYRPTTAAVGVNNPKRTGLAILSEYTPLTGEVGTQLVIPVSFVAAGDLTRATA